MQIFDCGLDFSFSQSQAKIGSGIQDSSFHTAFDHDALSGDVSCAVSAQINDCIYDVLCGRNLLQGSFFISAVTSYNFQSVFFYVDASAAYLTSGFRIDVSAMAVEIHPGATALTRPRA